MKKSAGIKCKWGRKFFLFKRPQPVTPHLDSTLYLEHPSSFMVRKSGFSYVIPPNKRFNIRNGVRKIAHRTLSLSIFIKPSEPISWFSFLKTFFTTSWQLKLQIFFTCFWFFFPASHPISVLCRIFNPSILTRPCCWMG